MIVGDEGIDMPTEDGGSLSPFLQQVAKLGHISGLHLDEEVQRTKVGQKEKGIIGSQ